MSPSHPRPTLPRPSAAHAAGFATLVGERPSGSASGRSHGGDARRVLIASEDRRFLGFAAAKLRGTPIHPTLVTGADKVAREVARVRPHVLIISQALMAAEPSLEVVLPRRHPGLPVLVVSSGEGTDRTRDWRVASWGGVGVVDPGELLRGQVLPLVIIELSGTGPGDAGAAP